MDGDQLKDLSDKEFELFRKLIYDHSGIALNETKKELLRTRLRKRLVRDGYTTYKDYYDDVLNDSSGRMMVPLLDDISTNLTSFFREINHFHLLDKTMPDWIAEKEKAGDKVFRAWSAGCSTGEEPYSLMFTLLSHLGDKIPPWNIKFLATDLNTEVLTKASNGIYPKERLANVPAPFMKAYVENYGEDRGKQMVRIKDEVRNFITYRRLNLMRPRFPFKHKFDFIFCRNVMIYFDKETQEALVQKYSSHLRSGGYLFIGHSESLTGLNHDLSYVIPTVYKKK